MLVVAFVCGLSIHAIATSQPEAAQPRRVATDFSVPLPSLIRPEDRLVIFEWAGIVVPEVGELHRRKPLSEELDDLSRRAPMIALVSIKSSQSFLTRRNTDINTSVSVVVQQLVKASEPLLKPEKTFDILQGGGEITIGQAKVRIEGYIPFTNGGRYLMWFVKASDKSPIVAIDWMSVDSAGKLTNSTPPNWRDRDMGMTHLFGLPVDWVISELRSRKEK